MAKAKDGREAGASAAPNTVTGPSPGADRIKVRWVGPPVEGVHPIVGGVVAGGEYEVEAVAVEGLGEGFEIV